ncbi:MAG: hypothetical protein HC800_10265 [Phormidesmis sp. RL_2_1]|nr:hypothetical protein [Phormidesmis sp. RL_2_1]
MSFALSYRFCRVSEDNNDSPHKGYANARSLYQQRLTQRAAVKTRVVVRR